MGNPINRPGDGDEKWSWDVLGTSHAFFTFKAPFEMRSHPRVGWLEHTGTFEVKLPYFRGQIMVSCSRFPAESANCAWDNAVRFTQQLGLHAEMMIWRFPKSWGKSSIYRLIFHYKQSILVSPFVESPYVYVLKMILFKNFPITMGSDISWNFIHWFYPRCRPAPYVPYSTSVIKHGLKIHHS